MRGDSLSGAHEDVRAEGHPREQSITESEPRAVEVLDCSMRGRDFVATTTWGSNLARWREGSRAEWTALARRRGLGLDLVRIYLGIALLVRGALFVADQTAFMAWMDQAGWMAPVALGHLVAFAHLGGGIFLALGLFTRLAAAVQIPLLLGAVFMVHWREGLMQLNQSLELSVLVLVLLIVFVVFGSGSLSLDAVLGIGRDKERDRS